MPAPAALGLVLLAAARGRSAAPTIPVTPGPAATPAAGQRPATRAAEGKVKPAVERATPVSPALAASGGSMAALAAARPAAGTVSRAVRGTDSGAPHAAPASRAREGTCARRAAARGRPAVPAAPAPPSARPPGNPAWY